MRGKALVPRMLALLAVTLLGVYYIAFDVLGINIGPSPYKVTAMLPRAGGVYASADVTYRGVAVGKVTALHLSTNGVAAVLSIRHGVKIPADSTAKVRQLSALGEQFVDLVPTGAAVTEAAAGDAQYLHNGSVIGEGSTAVPTPIGTTLSDVGTLVKGINPADIRTIESILFQGFNGSAGDLRTIVVTGQALANALIDAAPGTIELIQDGNTVLQTAKNTNGEFGVFTHQINQLTGTFSSLNSQLKALLVNGSAAASQTSSLLNKDNGAISGLISNLGQAGSVSLAYQPAVQALFAVLPVVAGDLGSLGANGQINGELALNTQDTICSYLSSAAQALPTARTGAASLNNTCPISAPDLLQRGAQHAPVVP